MRCRVATGLVRPTMALCRRSFDALLLGLDVPALSVNNALFRRVYIKEVEPSVAFALFSSTATVAICWSSSKVLRSPFTLVVLPVACSDIANGVVLFTKARVSVAPIGQSIEVVLGVGTFKNTLCSFATGRENNSTSPLVLASCRRLLPLLNEGLCMAGRLIALHVCALFV